MRLIKMTFENMVFYYWKGINHYFNQIFCGIYDLALDKSYYLLSIEAVSMSAQ